MGTTLRSLVFLSLLGALAGCAGDDQQPQDKLEDAPPVVAQYVKMVRANYADTLAAAEALDTAINTFVDTPTAENLEAAKQAWEDARVPYGQTEVYRFYDGPIDDVNGPEGAINAWPLDEAFIDYVLDDEGAGIINHPTDFPTLDADTLAAENENGGEKNIATGYHAIEFLLWGQDLSDSGPGERPYTDYVTGEGGTAANQDRRGAYLKVVSKKLVDDLTYVADAWKDEDGTYGTEFGDREAADALQKILLGLGSLSGAELSGERMTTAYDNKDQEDEHSCFSDYTLTDYHYNAIGLQNVWLGKYGSDDGAGLDELVEARDSELAAEVTQQIADAIAAIDAVPAPFDQAILGNDEEPGRVKVLAAIRALQKVSDSMVKVADTLGVKINLAM